MFMQDFARFARSSAPVTRTGLAAPTAGMVAGTLVETVVGWQPVESLRLGDRVHSLDGGLCRVLGIDRGVIGPEHTSALLLVPGGAFDNCTDMLLLPGQHLLVDTLGALEDAAFARLPAAALEGHRGIRRVPVTRETEVIAPLFAEEEAIWANSGVLMHCRALGREASAADSFFPLLGRTEAQALLLPYARAA